MLSKYCAEVSQNVSLVTTKKNVLRMTNEMQDMSRQRQGGNESEMLCRVSDVCKVYDERTSRILCAKHSDQTSQEIQLMVKWKINIKEYVPGQTTDSKEYFKIFTLAVRNKFVNNNGQLQERGYKIYLSLLGVIGKNSVYGSPIRKSYIWFEKIETLKDQELVVYNDIKYEYVLTNKGDIMMEVLARSLTNKGTPVI